MFLVQTELRNSSVHGFGVFAREFIPAGTRVWEYLDGFDRRMSPEFVASLPEVARQTVLHYCAFWKGAYVTSADNSRFLNHSFTPNLRSFEEPDCDVALRDIQIGDELTEDYREFDARFSERGILEGREGIPQPSSPMFAGTKSASESWATLVYAKEWLAARSDLNYPIYQTVRVLVAEIERLSSPAPLTQGEQKGE